MQAKEKTLPEVTSYEDSAQNSVELNKLLTQDLTSFDQDDSDKWDGDYIFVDLNHKDYKNGLKLKCDIFSLEFPFFLLSKGRLPNSKKAVIESEFLNYEWNIFNDGEYSKSIRAVASAIYGMPTIYDKNILVFVTSCFAHLINVSRKKKRKFSVKKIRFLASHFFSVFKISNGGESYKRILISLKRLRHTVFETNVKHKNIEIFDDFQFFEKIRIVKVDNKYNYIEVTISDWLLDAIDKGQILTLHPDYFDLSPIHKRIYEVSRKHCGNQKSFDIGEYKFEKKINASSRKELRRVVKDPNFEIPDYFFQYKLNNVVTIIQKNPNKLFD